MAKQDTNIPEEVIESVRQEVEKERLDKNKMDADCVKGILKKLGYNKYYEHKYFILYKVSNIEPLSIPEHVLNVFTEIFLSTLEPFEKHKHIIPGRRNYFSYSYILHQICRIQGMEEYLIYFPLLKNREKLAMQDQLWKLVCADINLPFYATV